jgi:fused signal recognition particle receptor
VTIAIIAIVVVVLALATTAVVVRQRRSPALSRTRRPREVEAAAVDSPPTSKIAAPQVPELPAEELPAEALPAEELPAEEFPAPQLATRLGRARALLSGPLSQIRGRSRLEESTFDELEEALILADVGITTTTVLLDGLRARIRQGAVSAEPAAVLADLRRELLDLFAGEDRSLHHADEGPTVWLFVGVNGVGKTTTIGKLATAEQRAGRRVVLAAGDTFRAAAGEQLRTWAERSGAGIVQGADGADPSSVVFDAVQHAAARGADLVLADSAGRLHTKTNLMEELKKVRRIAERPPGQLREVLLVLDATTGQNGLVQARQFAEAVGVTGIVLTKLDGTAKGGIVLAIRAELGLPIKLVGLGEGADDLVEFVPEEFVAALFDA